MRELIASIIKMLAILFKICDKFEAIIINESYPLEPT